MKRLQLNAALLAVVVALAILVWFAQKKENKKAPLTSLAPATVDRIAIEYPGAPAIRLSKQNQAWVMTAPVKAEVDPFEVNALVGLADTGVQGKLDNADPKQLGLDPAAYRITLNDLDIAFGGEEPLKYRRYVRVGKELPVLINDPSSAALDRDYSDLVAKNLLPAGAEITRIAAPGLSMEKTADGAWTSPDHPQAKRDQLLALAAAWKDAKSMWNAAIVPDDLKAEPVTVTVSLADGRTLGFRLVARDPQLVLASPDLGVRYTLAKTDVDRLLNLDKPATTAPAAAPPSPQPTATPPAGSATP